MRDDIKRMAAEAGCVSCGIAAAAPVEPSAMDAYRRWIADGHHGYMEYLSRYDRVRSDPRELLEGARSIICCAFPYALQQDCKIASYALGDDYHEVVRNRLEAVAGHLREHCGATSCVCVDTAPILERYWAVKSGVGYVGRNHQLIVPGYGSAVVLGEIVTTAVITPDDPCSLTCGDCMACVNRCPGGALRPDGTFDATRCLSYLTIEYRGELPADLDLGAHLYGCDECQLCCPHNKYIGGESALPEFDPRPAVINLTPDDLAEMEHETYCDIFRHSSIRRAKLSQLHRNARQVLGKSDKSDKSDC